MQKWSWTWTSPGCSVVKNPLAKAGERGSIPWRRKWLPTPVFLPRKSHGRRSIIGYSPWGAAKRVVHNWETLLNTHWHKPRFSAFSNTNSQYFNSRWCFTYITPWESSNTDHLGIFRRLPHLIMLQNPVSKTLISTVAPLTPRHPT